MSRGLARLAGLTAGYLLVVLIERLILPVAEQLEQRIDVDEDQGDEVEPFDVTDVVKRHSCSCCRAA